MGQFWPLSSSSIFLLCWLKVRKWSGEGFEGRCCRSAVAQGVPRLNDRSMARSPSMAKSVMHVQQWFTVFAIPDGEGIADWQRGLVFGCMDLHAPPMAFKTDAHTKVNEPVFRFQLRTAHPRHRCQATKVVLNPRNHGTVLATLAVNS